MPEVKEKATIQDYNVPGGPYPAKQVVDTDALNTLSDFERGGTEDLEGLKGGREV